MVTNVAFKNLNTASTLLIFLTKCCFHFFKPFVTVDVLQFRTTTLHLDNGWVAPYELLTVVVELVAFPRMFEFTFGVSY